MLRTFTFLFFFFCASILSAENSSINELFQERAKCAVAVKFSVELEENRSQVVTMGMVADEKGLVVIPAGELPNVRADEMKDFKIHFYGGDADGYSAEYLGADSFTGVNFLRIKGGTPEGRVPYTKFPRAKGVWLGDFVWGVGFYSERFMFEPHFMRSYISDIGLRPLKKATAAENIAAVGTAIFNFKGEFVGWGQGQSADTKMMYARGLNGLAISLVSPVFTNSFILPEELDEILKNIPSKPSGDNHGWIGIVNTKVLKRDVAKMMGIENKCALLISDVVKGQPADNAGIKKGDIIVGVDGKDLELLSFDDYALFNFARKYVRKKSGEKISLSIIRGSDSPKTFEVTLTENPKQFRQSQTKYFKRIGFSLREYLFDDAIARKAIDKKCDSPVVKYVKPNSPAASAMPSKLAVGDIIKEINSKPVANYAEAIEVLSKIDDDSNVKSVVILAEDFKETKVVRVKLD